jgi:hypothetical protein
MACVPYPRAITGNLLKVPDPNSMRGKREIVNGLMCTRQLREWGFTYIAMFQNSTSACIFWCHSRIFVGRIDCFLQQRNSFAALAVLLIA